MGRIVTASLTVSFGEPTGDAGAGSDTLSLEVDSREDGLNRGRTSFYQGDEVFLLLYAGPSVSVRQVVTTKGGVRRSGAGQRTIDQTLTLTGSDNASLSHPVASMGSRGWVGQGYTIPDLGGAPSGTLDGSRIIWPVNVAGVYEVSYSAHFTSYRLAGVQAAQAMVVAIGEVDD